MFGDVTEKKEKKNRVIVPKILYLKYLLHIYIYTAYIYHTYLFHIYFLCEAFRLL